MYVIYKDGKLIGSSSSIDYVVEFTKLMIDKAIGTENDSSKLKQLYKDSSKLKQLYKDSSKLKQLYKDSSRLKQLYKDSSRLKQLYKDSSRLKQLYEDKLVLNSPKVGVNKLQHILARLGYKLEVAIK